MQTPGHHHFVLRRVNCSSPLIPKSLRSGTSIAGEEGFEEQIADGIAEGKGRNGFARSEAADEGSVGSGGGQSASGECRSVV